MESNNILADAAEAAYRNAILKYQDIDMSSVHFRDLNEKEVQDLSGRIAVLSIEDRNILYCYYCLHMPADEINLFLDTDMSKERAIFAVQAISDFMGLENEMISDVSMEQACDLAMQRKIELTDITGVPEPHYSAKFRRMLKDIPAAQKPTRITVFAKRAAAFIAAATLCFSVAFAANAGFREQLIAWIVMATQEYSKFRAINNEANKSVDLKSFRLEYIPEGYEFIEMQESRVQLIYIYANNDSHINISLMKENIEQFVNTENATVNTFSFKDQIAYQWTINEKNYMIWQQDSIVCRIIGDISSNEIIKIAEGITKREN